LASLIIHYKINAIDLNIAKEEASNLISLAEMGLLAETELSLAA